MPSGKTHANISIMTAGALYIYTFTHGEPPFHAIATALGCALGVLITPDLDVKGTRADNLVRNKIGIWFAIVWGILWNPYSALIEHRSILSHGLIIGTVGRLLYISVPLALLGILPTLEPFLVRMIAGLFISDNLHIGADFLVSGLKDIMT